MGLSCEENYNSDSINLDLLKVIGSIEDYETAKTAKEKIADEYKRYLSAKYPDLDEFIQKLDIDTLKNVNEKKIQIIDEKLKENPLFKTLVSIVDKVRYPSTNFEMLKHGTIIAFLFDNEIKETVELSLNVSQELFTSLLELVDRIIYNILHDP